VRDSLIDAVAHLVGAASAYKIYAKRHASQGKAETDALFSTRVADMDKAVLRGVAALRARVTLEQRVEELVQEHGSVRKAGDALNIDPGYMSRLRSGGKIAPTDAVLTKLGLRRVTHYERIEE